MMGALHTLAVALAFGTLRLADGIPDWVPRGTVVLVMGLVGWLPVGAAWLILSAIGGLK